MTKLWGIGLFTCLLLTSCAGQDVKRDPRFELCVECTTMAEFIAFEEALGSLPLQDEKYGPQVCYLRPNTVDSLFYYSGLETEPGGGIVNTLHASFSPEPIACGASYPLDRAYLPNHTYDEQQLSEDKQALLDKYLQAKTYYQKYYSKNFDCYNTLTANDDVPDCEMKKPLPKRKTGGREKILMVQFVASGSDIYLRVLNKNLASPYSW